MLGGFGNIGQDQTDYWATRGTVPAAPDIQQMQDLLAIQVRLRDAAQLNRAAAVRALIGLAEALCVGPWDEEKRAGHNPEEWPPERIGEFVIRHLRGIVRTAALANRPQLAEHCEHLARELVDACHDIGRLRVQLQFAQKAANKPAERTAQAVAGRRRMPAQASGPNRPAKIVVDAAAVRADTPPGEAAPPKRVDDLLLLITASGLARNDEICQRLAARWDDDATSHEAGQVIAIAIQRSLVEARGCAADWASNKSGQFLLLTPAGSARATKLGVDPATSAYEVSQSRNWTPEHLYLALKATEMLTAEGYTDVDLTPGTVPTDGAEYWPDLSAREGAGLVQIECPISREKARVNNWSVVERAGGGTIRLIAPNRKTMYAITSEIKASNGARATIWASNVTDYLTAQRGPSGTLWLHQR
jgi:hypothetical protein